MLQVSAEQIIRSMVGSQNGT